MRLLPRTLFGMKLEHLPTLVRLALFLQTPCIMPLFRVADDESGALVLRNKAGVKAARNTATVAEARRGAGALLILRRWSWLRPHFLG